MSESDSDTEADKIHRTKRSVVVKFNFDGSELDSDSDGPSVGANTLKGSNKKLSSTDDDSSTFDSDEEVARKGTAKTFQPKTYNFDNSDDSTSDDEWHPGTSARPSTSAMAMSSSSLAATATATASTSRGIIAAVAAGDDTTPTDSDGGDESTEVLSFLPSNPRIHLESPPTN